MKSIKLMELRTRRVRLGEVKEPYLTAVDAPDIVASVTSRLCDGMDREIFLVFMLDVKNKVLGYIEAGLGSVDSCPVDPREVFRTAIHLGSSAIIVAHNHPSGNTDPSTDDISLTRRLVDCGDMLGIPMLDHVIVAGNNHCSLAAQGYV